MKYLGIDYGSKRVGIAVSDDTGRIAFPKKVIKNQSPERLIAEIKEMCKEQLISDIVIGDSRDYKGRPNEIMKHIEPFSVALEESVGLPVHFQLEFMTSMQAERPFGKPTKEDEQLKGDKALLDASAAAIILQSFLDSRNSSSDSAKI
jgi:putative Holliday junction resolvase